MLIIYFATHVLYLGKLEADCVINLYYVFMDKCITFDQGAIKCTVPWFILIFTQNPQFAWPLTLLQKRLVVMVFLSPSVMNL